MAEALGLRPGQCDETDPVGSEYDVFLSFRGPDTRDGITDVLHEFMTEKGIRVFRDDEEIRRGQEIGEELVRAIRGSRVYVVVFSRGYASSAWCLRELAMMVECRRDSSSGKVILPIFYDVDPQDVKLRTVLYQGALDEHRERYSEEGVKRWEEALVKVGGISGWDYKRGMGYGKFGKVVAQNVLRHLKIRYRSLPQYLIGVDDRVERVLTLLNCESPDVRVVMLHGMGGIGKTTLANAIFNKISSQFDGCSFLANVRESSTGEGGVTKLQRKLLEDILGCLDMEIGDSSDGKNQIDTRLRGKRVLIILDDVSERFQLKELVRNCSFFGIGTRIIVTTRDRSVCKGLTGPGDVCTYEMEGMTDDHALQLFSRHAFGEEGPPEDFVPLSKQVIRMTGNLPLALEVIGGHLFGENKNVWEYTLEKLKRVPDEGVVKILRISYDSLGEREKQIFLDIACFPNSQMPRKYASYMWEACDFYPKCGLDVLHNRSLIKVLNDDEDKYKIWSHDDQWRMYDLVGQGGRKIDKYWMHDLIREMGRQIVRSESLLHCPGIRSRLWDPEETVNVVNRKQGAHHVLAIDLGFGVRDPYTREELEGMSNLRFVIVGIAPKLIREFRNFRTKLLWLRCGNLWWEKVPNPTFFRMNNLVVLEIYGNGLTDYSMKNLRMPELRVLDILHARITRMPDLSHCSKLEIIDLKYCKQLKELHSSVGLLRVLKCLKIVGCGYLRRLPAELGSAKCMQELILVNCWRLRELPESIGGLGELRILRWIGSNIRKLTSSIENLKSLEVLQIEGSPLLRFETSLEVQNLARCNLSELCSLRSLKLSGLDQVGEFQGIEKLRGLQKLNLDVGGKSDLLSAGLGALSRLEELHLCKFRIVDWPRLDLIWSIGSEATWLDGLDTLENLSYLTLEGFRNIKSPDLASLRRLCHLRLVGCEQINLPGIEKMELLEELTVLLCGGFQDEIPDLSNLGRLKKVKFACCHSLRSVPRLVGDCHLSIFSCGKLRSFEGLYRQYNSR